MMIYAKRFTLLALAVILLMGSFFCFKLLTPLSSSGKWKEVQIPEGATYRQGINILKREGIIESELVFLVIGRITMMDRKIRAGFYNLSASLSPWEIFDALKKGRIVQYAITIPGGSTLENMKVKFKYRGLLDEASWQIVYDKEFLKSLDVYAPSLEGYIYPETYNFSKGMKPEVIFGIMVQKMRDEFDETLRKRAQEIGMSENNVLTLASIIEREALHDKERPIISSVYHNRLKKDMKLQADPTVIYGVNRISRRITYSDLRRDTPYNTYVIKGLPPGPVATPGIKSIKAALYPAETDYLFFVSKNDGTHHFSKTDAEHINAVTLYQINNTNTNEKEVAKEEPSN
ncbi:MAG: endolytic transglycosylase MltG [Nitrospirota bacterium]